MNEKTAKKEKMSEVLAPYVDILIKWGIIENKESLESPQQAPAGALTRAKKNIPQHTKELDVGSERPLLSTPNRDLFLKALLTSDNPDDWELISKFCEIHGDRYDEPEPEQDPVQEKPKEPVKETQVDGADKESMFEILGDNSIEVLIKLGVIKNAEELKNLGEEPEFDDLKVAIGWVLDIISTTTDDLEIVEGFFDEDKNKFLKILLSINDTDVWKLVKTFCLIYIRRENMEKYIPDQVKEKLGEGLGELDQESDSASKQENYIKISTSVVNGDQEELIIPKAKAEQLGWQESLPENLVLRELGPELISLAEKALEPLDGDFYNEDNFEEVRESLKQLAGLLGQETSGFEEIDMEEQKFGRMFMLNYNQIVLQTKLTSLLGLKDLYDREYGVSWNQDDDRIVVLDDFLSKMSDENRISLVHFLGKLENKKKFSWLQPNDVKEFAEVYVEKRNDLLEENESDRDPEDLALLLLMHNKTMETYEYHLERAEQESKPNKQTIEAYRTFIGKSKEEIEPLKLV